MTSLNGYDTEPVFTGAYKQLPKIQAQEAHIQPDAAVVMGIIIVMIAC